MNLALIILVGIIVVGIIIGTYIFRPYPSKKPRKTPPQGAFRVVKYGNNKYYIEQYRLSAWKCCWVGFQTKSVIWGDRTPTAFDTEEKAISMVNELRERRDLIDGASTRIKVVWNEADLTVNQITEGVKKLTPDERHQLLKQLIEADRKGDDALATKTLGLLGELE